MWIRGRHTPLLLLCCLCACEPMGPVAGGKLSGTVTAPPVEWSTIASIENVLLETDPDDPYSVTVWGVALGDNYYVASGEGGKTRWARNITDDRRVILKANGALYELLAERISDPQELADVYAEYLTKYDLDPREDFAKDAWVFRLDRP